MRHTYLYTLFLLSVISSTCLGQTRTVKDSLMNGWWYQRIQQAPERVYKKFEDAGMSPVNHDLSKEELEIFQNCVSLLPSTYQNVLKRHLHSFSFMDNMPNTALTSQLDSSSNGQTFNITFRAGIFNQTISEWATWKENLCFNPNEDDNYEVRIEAGDMNAMVYILLHEATHIMDQVMGITPKSDNIDTTLQATSFTKNVWANHNQPIEAFKDSVLEETRFRGGRPIPVEQAPDIYRRLKRTPFVSLYGMASWNEDLAEIMSIYHLTSILEQPFRVFVSKNGDTLFWFEPMDNALVKNRLDQLDVFYSK